MLNTPYTDRPRAPARNLRPAEDAALAKLAALAPLSPAEVELVRGLAAHREQHAPGAEIYGEGSSLRPRVILSGWACRMRLLPDGRRQIFAFLIPGDTVGVSPRPQAPGPCAVTALTRVETADAAPLREACADGRATALAQACALAGALEEGHVLDHLMRLGRQTALERTVHLFLELRHRLAAVGLAQGARFPLPLTQEILADALGLSIVHVNRTLQQLRRDKLIEMRAGWVERLDPEGLSARAAFTPPLLRRSGPEKRSFAAGPMLAPGAGT